MTVYTEPAAWASGAELLYVPLARDLVSRIPGRLRGARVVDAGAGTGAASRALVGVGARVLAVDLSLAMLTWDAHRRAPAVCGDLLDLPVRTDGVDAVVAPFVVSHFEAPDVVLREFARITRPGGAICASVFSIVSRFVAKDAIDVALAEHGLVASDSYERLRGFADALGTADAMADAATKAGLTQIEADDRPVPAGVLSAEQLVAYRFGMPHVATWLRTLDSSQQTEARAAAVAAARAVVPEPAVVAPSVVTLVARV